MAEKERGKKKEKLRVEPAPSSSGQSKDRVKATPGFLQEFLATIKVNRLINDMNPAALSKQHITEIEEGLASGDLHEKQQAISKLNSLAEAKDMAVEKSKAQSLKEIVDGVKAPAERRSRLLEVAESIEQDMAKVNSGIVLEQEQLNNIQLKLELLATGLGVEGSPEKLEDTISRVEYLIEATKIRERKLGADPLVSPLKLYEEEFGDGKDHRILKLRDVPGSKIGVMQKRLNAFRTNINRELIDQDRGIDKLSSNDLLARINEVGYWKSNKQALYGKGWRGSNEMESLRDILTLVEAEYIVELESRLWNEIKSSGKSEEYVILATQSVLNSRKRVGRSDYDFQKNIPKDKTPYEAFLLEVEQSSKIIEGKSRSKRRIAIQRSEEGYVGHVVGGETIHTSVDDAENNYQQAMGMQERVDKIAKKLGIHFDEGLMRRLEEPDGLKNLLNEARKKLSPEELRDYEKILSSISGTEGSGRFSGVQAELFRLSKEAKKTGNYAPYMIKLQAYIDRVGLRETSSDFQFAIVMREAKDEISRINADAGGKFDLWQEAQFLPSITSLDEKTYYGLIPRVMTHSRMQYELDDKYSNWLAMQVGGKGGKKALSVASFYQLLQRGDVANRVIAAPINGNDGLILQLWVEHVWGDGAKLVMDKRNSNLISHVLLADGKTVVKDIDVSYFSMDAKSSVDKSSTEKLKIADFLDQSMWMAHYAEKMWWYSGEWEAFARDFPGERLPQANKRLLSIGSAFRDYGIEYGKFDEGYVELAKAGVLLQDFRTYKGSDVIVANIRHMLYDNGITSAKEGEVLGKGIFKALSKHAYISEDYQPLSSLRPVEEVRLMGKLGEYTTPEERWNWYKQSQEKIGRRGVPEYSTIAGYKGRGFDNLRGDEEAWFVQAEEIEKLFDDLSKQRRELGKLNWEGGVLYKLIDKQSFIATGNHRRKGEESLDLFLREFEYSSVLNYAELRKGTDPLDYQKYSEAKAEAASLMTEVLNGVPTPQKIAELFTKMRSYMPPDQVVTWFDAFREKQVQLRTFQTIKYDIAMTDLEEWEMKKRRGEIKEDHPPSIIMGYNPAVFKIKDERGDSWNVKGADGFRVTRKKKEWGNHMKKTRDIQAMTSSQIELENRLYVGNRWLTKHKAEEILENSFGLAQVVNKICRDRGWDSKSKQARFLKKWGSKAALLLRQHPLFDDPVWAFWNILNELKEYGEEVQKEMVKSIAK